jgi:ACS family sodium-dependent inorganic phosphate cotransporter
VLLLCAAVFISSIDRTSISVGVVAMRTQYHWNETWSGLVLSAFFIGYALMMIPSGALANRYGGRIVLGLAVLSWSLVTLITPPAAETSFPALVLARIALGAGEAAVFPACYNLIAHSVPPSRRSRVVALLTSSLHLGTMFALPTTAWLVRRYGWPAPFYVFGIVGCLWTAAWFASLSARHGRAAQALVLRRGIPWRALLRLPSVWAIVVTHFCGNWVLYVLLAWSPSYFKSTFGVPLLSVGALAALPWLLVFLTGNAAGAIADRMLASGFSATFVRKLMQSIGLGVGAIFLFQLAGATSITAVLVLMCCATGCWAFVLAGFAPNCFDVAPHHAEVIWGISNTIATLPGLFGVLVTGWLVDRTGSFATPFRVTAAVSLLGALVFVALGSGERGVD